MNFPWQGYLLIAQFSNWQRLGDGLHRGRTRWEAQDILPLVAVLVVIGIVIGVVVKLRKRNDMSQRCNDPEKLFRELCLIHKLDRHSQKLLARLAEAASLRQPAEVFVRPSLYQGEQLPKQLKGDQEQLQRISKRLF